MLAIQPVNFTKSHSFKGAQEYDGAYTKHQYEADKTKLEEHLDELNEVIENTQVPKPVRAIGKVATVGIGAALGFVGMRFGAQGIVKMGKEGIAYFKKLAQKPKFTKMLNGFKNVYVKIKNFVTKNFDKIKNNPKVQGAITKFTDGFAKFSQKPFCQKIKNVANKFVAWKPVQKVCEFVKSLFAKVKSIKGQQVENATVNLFAVSGGVTGGITALQEATKGQE